MFTWLKCKLGFHTWQYFLLKPKKVCIYCRKIESSFKNNFNTGVSFTGFNALKK